MKPEIKRSLGFLAIMLAFFGGSALAAELAIPRLGRLPLGEPLEEIFLQLERAVISPPTTLLLALSAIWAAATLRMGKGLAIGLGVLVLVILCVASILLTTVNGVLLADIIPALVQLAGSGIL